jgi:hypothetical protein
MVIACSHDNKRQWDGSELLLGNAAQARSNSPVYCNCRQQSAAAGQASSPAPCNACCQ